MIFYREIIAWLLLLVISAASWGKIHQRQRNDRYPFGFFSAFGLYTLLLKFLLSLAPTAFSKTSALLILLGSSTTYIYV